jgi:inorganic pyrophosphatase
MADLGKRFERELEEFFVNYHCLSGDEYRILSVKGRTAALRTLREAARRAKKAR